MGKLGWLAKFSPKVKLGGIILTSLLAGGLAGRYILPVRQPKQPKPTPPVVVVKIRGAAPAPAEEFGSRSRKAAEEAAEEEEVKKKTSSAPAPSPPAPPAPSPPSPPAPPAPPKVMGGPETPEAKATETRDQSQLKEDSVEAKEEQEVSTSHQYGDGGGAVSPGEHPVNPDVGGDGEDI